MKSIKAWVIWYDGKDGRDKPGLCYGTRTHIFISSSKKNALAELDFWLRECGKFYKLIKLNCYPQKD